MNDEKQQRKAYKVSIHGRVQGVGFRYSAIEAAKRYGVTGWVRNEVDGSVSAFCAGTIEATDNFISWCRKGPPSAVVQRVDVQELPYRARYSSFSVAF